jgi:hypothetical protein
VGVIGVRAESRPFLCADEELQPNRRTPPRSIAIFVSAQSARAGRELTDGDVLESLDGMMRVIWYTVPSLTKEQAVYEAKVTDPRSSDLRTQFNLVTGQRRLTKPWAGVVSRT